MPLNGGRPTVLWSHPLADVYRLAATPDGKELAMAVGAKNVDSTIIYLLGADGSVLTVRKTPTSWAVASMIFVPAPTDPKGPVRLYWTESSGGDAYDTGTNTFPMRVMTYDGSSVQSPVYLNTYPGNSTSSLMVFRLSDIPTRFQVLRNNDLISGATLSSPDDLGRMANDHRHRSGHPSGVAEPQRICRWVRDIAAHRVGHPFLRPQDVPGGMRAGWLAHLLVW